MRGKVWRSWCTGRAGETARCVCCHDGLAVAVGRRGPYYKNTLALEIRASLISAHGGRHALPTGMHGSTCSCESRCHDGRIETTADPPAAPTTDVRFVSVLTKNTYALILAGGRGSRLKNLTDWRAKPAVPFGGKFRIIDFPLSNCVNSGHPPHRRRHAIQVAQPDPPHPARLELPRRAHEGVHRSHAGPAARAGALVPGHRGRGVPEPGHPARPTIPTTC